MQCSNPSGHHLPPLVSRRGPRNTGRVTIGSLSGGATGRPCSHLSLRRTLAVRMASTAVSVHNLRGSRGIQGRLGRRRSRHRLAESQARPLDLVLTEVDQIQEGGDEDTAQRIADCDGGDIAEEFGNCDLGTAQHANGQQVEVGDAVLKAQRHEALIARAMAITLPSTLRAATLSHTARHTNMLHSTPRKKAVGASS